MKYLLDTCVLSEVTKVRPDAGVVRWLEQVDPQATWVSVLTVGELENGIARLPAGRRRDGLVQWLGGLRLDYQSRILDVTADVAATWGKLTGAREARGEALPVIDALLGATALVHSLCIVTRNTTDLARTGAKTLNPWAG